MDIVWITFYLLVFLLSLALLYDRLTRTIPTRLRADQAPKSEFGVIQVDGFASALRAHGTDVVFVHGLGSNPDTTWRARKVMTQHDIGAQPTATNQEYVCWVSDFLRDDIPDKFREDMRVFFYNYDSYWQRDAVQTRLWNLSHSLLDHVSTKIRTSGKERDRSLIFVGHSYGGLIVKQALVKANRDSSFTHIAEYTRAVFFLGTPHRGSSFGGLGSTVARALQLRGSNPSILAVNAYDSTSLLDLHRDFDGFARNGLQVTNFFEQRKTPLIKFWFVQWEKFCVSEHSATYEGGSIQNLGLPVDHYGLNRFGSKDQSYKIILSKLLETLHPIALQKPQRQSSVPLGKVPSYTIRHSLSLEIDEKMRILHENSSVSYALTLHGLGGAGKSQLALDYVEQHKDRYNSILWIDAQDKETVRSSFERCVTKLHLSVDNSQSQGPALADSPTVQTMLTRLEDRKETDEEWLVVIDNADDLKREIKKIIPKGIRGSLLITSQDKRSPGLVDNGCEKVQIDMLAPHEAGDLLLRRLEWEIDEVPEDICRDRDMIAKQLGYLPLAVDIAGAYIGNDSDERGALKQYLKDYDKHQDELLQRDDLCELSPSEKTVWTVWDTTLEMIESRYPKVRPRLLLAFLARFGGSVIQDELFRLASLNLSCTALGSSYGYEKLFPRLISFLETVMVKGSGGT